MEMERDTQTIFFKDLFFCLIRKWKPIVLFALIGAMLLGGMQIAQNKKAAAALNVPLSGEELSQREQVRQAIADTNTRIETQRAYLSSAPLMIIDPNQVYQSTLTLYVHTDYKIQPNVTYQNPDNRPAILTAYQQALSDGEVINHLAEETGLPSQHLHELFTFTQTISSPAILTVTISAPTEESAQLLLDLTHLAAADASASVADQTDKHSLSIQASQPVLRSDATIAEKQKQALQRLTLLQDQKAEWQKLQTSITITGDEASPLIHAVLGAVLGAFAVAAIVCIGHICSNKVYSERTLKNRTGIKVLGRAPSTDRHTKAGNWLRKAEGRVNNASAIDVIAANLRNTPIGYNGLLVVGSAPEADRALLRQALEKVEISFQDCGDLLTEPKAHDALSVCSAVVLVEKCNHSTYDDIEHVLEMISNQEKPVLGCVLLDG